MFFNRRIVLWLGLLCALAGAPGSRAQVWNAENEWNGAWEERYAEWIASDVKEDMFVPVNLAVDCADLCYVVRAIFARDNRLPYLASDRWGKKTGHFETGWNSLATAAKWQDDRRFRAFLVNLVQHVTTKSFPHDTYPVELNAETVKPGLVNFENLIASHSSFVGIVDPAQLIPVVFFESSVPPTLRFKSSTITDVYLYPPPVSSDSSGIVRWNWHVLRNGAWVNVADKEMPHYSLDIYEPDFPYRKQLSKALNQVVKQSTAQDGDIRRHAVDELTAHLEEEFRFRSDVVLKAQRILAQRGAYYRSDDFDYIYNTESRDQRLYQLLRTVWAALDEYEVDRQELFSALYGKTVEIDGSHPPVPMLYLFIAVDNHWIDHDAYVPAGERWGLRWSAEKQAWAFIANENTDDVLAGYMQPSGDSEN